MERKINFNPGPAALPDEVKEEFALAIRAYKNTGLSILELPHRSTAFTDIIEESKTLVRELCALNDDYEIVWLQGGGRLQFCMVPMNFLPDGSTAAYIDTGHWAHEAAEYAAYYGKCTIAATSAPVLYSSLPQWPVTFPDNTAYLHITTNNTIYGTQWHNLPEVNTHLIADMSSDILSGKRDYTQYAMFYAAAQKNLGIAGVALAVIRKDLLEKTARQVPPMLSYQHQVKQNSVVNTANVAGVYAALLMLRWTKQKGLDNIAAENNLKAKALYAAVDNSKVFNARVTEVTHRSMMNVCFTADSPGTEDAFMTLCKRNNIAGIEGHRVTGGFRVSLYNAVPLSSVETLVKLMQEFESSL